MRRPLSIVVAFLITAACAQACPFCPAPQVTLSERVSQSNAVALAQWVSATRKSNETPAATEFRIVHLHANPGKSLQLGDTVTLARYQDAKPGDLFLLLGFHKTVIEWDDPRPTSDIGYQYVIQAPPPESRDRLGYFLKFLEYPDETIAADAFNELAAADYSKVAALADKLPRDKIRKWLADPDFTNPRLGLYGLLLGLCGTEEDAELLARHIAAPVKSSEFRLGIDGIIGGYLVLTGAKGLDFIDKEKLRDTEGPTTEVFATLQALRFMWTYGDNRIPKARLKQSMRILIENPDLADIAITDLARWKDWSVQDRLIELYDHKDYQSVQHIKRAIISYTIAASRDLTKDSDAVPSHVAKARKHLAMLRERDPKAVRIAERLFQP